MIATKIKQLDSTVAPSIPSLPDKVTLECVEKDISTIQKVPIGVSKNTLKVLKYDFTAFTATSIASNKLANINSFMDSLLDIFVKIPNLVVFFIDTLQSLPSAKEKNREIIIQTLFSKLKDNSSYDTARRLILENLKVKTIEEYYEKIEIESKKMKDNKKIKKQLEKTIRLVDETYQILDSEEHRKRA